MKRVLVAVSVVAAVLNHQLVDVLASAGFVYGDHDGYRHVAVMPALVGALTVLAALLAAFYRDVRVGEAPNGDWLLAASRKLRSVPLGPLVFSVFVLQLVALFAIESAEQVISAGHLDAPLAWLGTSVPVALCVALAVTAVVVTLLRGFCDALHTASRALVRVLAAIVIALRSSASGSAEGSIDFSRPALRRQQSLLAFRSGLRAPPSA